MSAKTVFISYRRVDSAYAVDQLDERLKQAFGAAAVFRDVRSIEAGIAFTEDIRSALSEAQVGLVVIGPWWLGVTSDPNDPKSPRRLDDPTDLVRQEIETLLGRDGVRVIPLLLGGAGMPKADDLPPSMRGLPDRNGMVLQPYPDFEHSVELVIASVARILNVRPQSFGPHAQTSKETPPRISPTRLTVTGRKFVGREQELYLLDEAWGRSAGDKINIVSLIGQGGEGKTALVLEWYSRRSRHGWQSARRVFDWSFYSQGTNAQSSASADEFFNAAFEWFGHTGEIPKDAWTKGGKLADLIAAERTLLVLDGLEPLQHPPGGYGGEFKDPAMKALLRGLALHDPGLCILTSRTDITDLATFEHADGSCVRHLLTSLDATAARALLRELGVLGPEKELDEAIEWFHRHAYDLNLLGNYLAKCTPDHDIRGWQQKFPLLREDERIHPVPDAAGKRAGHGRRMLRAYERWLGPSSPATAILRLLGLFDRPVRSDLLDELRAAPVIQGLTDALVSLPDDEWLATLDQLQQLALISREKTSLPAETADASKEVSLSADDVPDAIVEQLLQGDDLPAEMKKLSRTELKQLLARLMRAEKSKGAKKAERPAGSVTYSVDCHPLLREHFAVELRDQHPDARREGHRRLYRYLCATTPDKDEPTLEDLQPLYQAVAHGCRAGLQQEACDEVYFARIQRGNEGYSTKKLGALGSDLGAIACFFEQPWSRVSNALMEADQAWLLMESAYSLRALGRLTEALEPLRAGLEMRVKQENWANAAISASNLSELELMLGEVARAVEKARQSVIYADRSGDEFQRMSKRTTLADALLQAGNQDEAHKRFREADEIQAQLQPEFPILYALQGFRSCDFLLVYAECAAWHIILDRGALSHLSSDNQSRLQPKTGEEPLHIKAIRAASDRAAQTLKWAKANNASLLSIALDHLTLCRAALYGAIPTRAEMRKQKEEIDDAMDGLRRAGEQNWLTAGLLTRAWLRSLSGQLRGPESAQTDLDEAWEIAERGPMRLHMADIHLYRARLFHAVKPYPWNKNPDGTERGPKDDLKDARKLIEQCGYWRRKEELEDAEAAAKNWD